MYGYAVKLHVLFTIAIATTLLPVSKSFSGDLFIPVDGGVTAGSQIPNPIAVINGAGMSDGNIGDKAATHNNAQFGLGMWLTGPNPINNGHADPTSTGWILFDFGQVVDNLDEMLIWNYNELGYPNLSLRQVDITYSVSDNTGLGALLHDNIILNPGTDNPALSATDTIALGTPGVGISARAVRITIDGGLGVGNYEPDPSLPYFGLSEVRFYSAAALPPTREWNSGGSGFWTNLNNWAPRFVPNSDEHIAVFGSAISAPSTVVVDDDMTVNAITFDNANKYAIAGTGSIVLGGAGSVITVDEGSHEFQVKVNLASNVAVNAVGGSIDFNNQIDLAGNTLSTTGVVNINHSVISSSGSGAIQNSGLLGTAGGSTIGGNLISTGTIGIDLSGAGAGQADLFNILGSASLQGAISVEALDGFVPATDVTILTATAGISLTGPLLLTGSGASLFSGIDVVGNSLVLSVAPSGPTGDYNGNGVVDAADYVVWRDALGANVPTGTWADGNQNGIVDAGDYLFWKARFGQTVGGTGSAAAVPEPMTMAIVTPALLGLGWIAQRRRESQ